MSEGRTQTAHGRTTRLVAGQTATVLQSPGMIRLLRSKPTHEKEHDEDDQDDADDTDAAVTVAIAVAAEATTEATE
jgi:hypothetical protein